MVEVLDDILHSLGTGKWNILTCVAVAYWFNVIVYHALGGAFLAPNVPHSCRIPYEEKNIQKSFEFNETRDVCHYTHAESNTMKPCQEWDYDDSVFSNTITQEFDLVCEREYLQSIYQSIYMFGSFLAAPVGGILADKYGRKLIFTIGSISYFIMSMISCWLPDISSILVFRFLMGLMHTPTMNAGYILGMEVCTPSMRSSVGVLMALPWAFGTILWGTFAYHIREWRWLQFSVSLPTILLLPALWFIDESPRWCAVRGQHDRALRIFKKASRWNGSTLPSDQQMRTLMKMTQQQASSSTTAETNMDQHTNKTKIIFNKLKISFLELFVLFRTPRLRMITLIVWMNFLLSSTVFYGLSLNAVNFSADPFLYMVISGCMEIPAYLFMPPVAARFGRKIPAIIGFSCSGLCLLVLPFVPYDMSWIVMTLVMAGKFCLSSVFQLLFLYSAELFPTEVRIQGFGSGIFVSRIGGMVAPFITGILGALYSWVPTVLFGVFSVLTGLVILLLPETLNRPLPDTINDLENGTQQRHSSVVDDAVEMNKLTADS